MDQRAMEFERLVETEWIHKIHLEGSRLVWPAEVTEAILKYVGAAVAEEVSRTKADAVALCATEFERGLLSGRADVAEARREERAKMASAWLRLRAIVADMDEHLNGPPASAPELVLPARAGEEPVQREEEHRPGNGLR